MNSLVLSEHLNELSHFVKENTKYPLLPREASWLCAPLDIDIQKAINRSLDAKGNSDLDAIDI